MYITLSPTFIYLKKTLSVFTLNNFSGVIIRNQYDNFKTSRIVDEAASGFLLTAALPIYAPISEFLPGVFFTFVANFLPALSKVFAVLKSLPRPLACLVLSLTVIDFFLTLNTFTML